MEFSIFLLLLTIGLCLAYIAGDLTVRMAENHRWFRFGLLAVPAALFFVTRTGAFLVLAPLLLFIAERETRFTGKNRAVFLTVFFLAVLSVTGYFYNREVLKIWSEVDRLKDGLLSAVPSFRNSRIEEVYAVAQYFRFIFPVIAVLLALFLFDRELGKKRRTYWYRFFRNFDHRAVYPLIAFWTVYILADRLKPGWVQPVWQNLVLELAVYFSFLYAGYGLATIQVAMRRFRLPFAWSLAVLYLLVVVSGPVFLFTLTFLMGIGVSDIWMHYRKKGFRKVIGK